MRVVRVLTRLNIGGPARQEIALGPELERLGIEDTLVAGVVESNERDLGDALGLSGVVRVPSLRRRVHLAHDVRAYRALRRIIRDARPDVVHTHTSKAGVLARSAAMSEGVPVTAHTFHGHVLKGYFPPGVSRVMALTERRMAAKTGLVITVSESVRQELADLRVAALDKLLVVPVGIDLEPYTSVRRGSGRVRRQLGLPATTKLVGFAGRFIPVKRLDRLLETAQRVCAEVEDAHFVLAGDGPERPNIERQLASAALQGRVHFLGWVTDMRDFYESVDLVVHSADVEATPVSLLEAGAACMPVVATRVGGIAEIVVDGETGVLVDQDAGAIASAITELLQDTDRCAAMGAAARRRVIERHGVRQLAGRLAELYETELQQHAGSRRRQ